MRRIWIIIAILGLVLTVNWVALASVVDLSGRWINVDSNTRGITILDIQISGAIVTVQTWGKGHPTDSDWGRVKAVSYVADSSSGSSVSNQALVASYDNNYSKKFVIIRMEEKGKLVAEVFTNFTGNNTRSSYFARYTFFKNLMAPTSGLATPSK